MMSSIKEIPQYSKNPLFILASNSEQQEQLAQERKKGFEQFVVVEPKVITQMLLVADGSKVLADAFAQQLALTAISPYNLGGGERNSSMFFGRREIISHIVSRENNNYIVVGSRQIGKSSLLKALEREYKNSEELDEDAIAGRVDRIIVYAMVEQEKFTLKELIERLKALGVSIGIGKIENSLSRLKISYIIERDNEGLYGFSLPLFREYVLKDDYSVKLMGEIEVFGEQEKN